jgi:signal transduction histidine kinase
VAQTNPAELEALFGLIVHDLRNPAATLGANLSFTREALSDPSVPREELEEALNDAQQALADVQRGLDQLAWIGRWFNDRVALSTEPRPLSVVFDGARQRMKFGEVHVQVPDEDVLVRGGEALERLIELLICNGHQHSRGKCVYVGARRDGERVVIELEDEGRPLSPELRSTAVTLAGQFFLKGRADGRYGRVAGLFVAGILAQAAGAELTAFERDGRNVFSVTVTIA